MMASFRALSRLSGDLRLGSGLKVESLSLQDLESSFPPIYEMALDVI